MGRFLPADFSKGDPNTIGGYRAVHGRPPAFEGRDGESYSVEIVCDSTGDNRRPIGAYLLFVRWRAEDPVATGHLESDYLAFADTEEAALAAAGGISLQDARARLDALIAAATARRPSRDDGTAG